MTPEEYINKELAKWKRIKDGEPFRTAVFETHRLMSNRIFNEGKDANETIIGQYNSTDGIYVNPKNSPKKFPLKGKGQKRRRTTQVTSLIDRKVRRVDIKSDYTQRKTGYFQSYKAFRQAIGRATDKVNLNLFGRLQNDFVTGLKRVGRFNYVVRIKSNDNYKKALGQEKRFNKPIFSLSKFEKDYFIETLNREIFVILNA